VLHLAFGIGEAEIYELDVLVLDQLEDIAGALHETPHIFSLRISSARRSSFGKKGPIDGPFGILDGVGAGFTGADADGVIDR
jgi:hypothetical protein